MVKVEILLAGEDEAHLEAVRDSSSRPGTGFSHLKFNNLGTCPKFPKTTGTTGTRR